ncbi:P1 family peptidase [Specibacter cremeus]|uniref:DmpA family aminopeptidase n=1 Tax=Specibacter cremeus TaxID=1629051 RepID=UPI000F766F57|nr:P1 family peptidase [Specibacter cremeus]
MTASTSPGTHSPDGRPRARGLGLDFDGTPGRFNAITDVPGLEVGYRTLIAGDGPLVDGKGPVRTGVTAILPRGRPGVGVPCAAGTYSFNGNGELTGRAWIDEAGMLAMPIALTSSHAVGACHQGIDQWVHRHRPDLSARWMLPVVGETWDGYLNDINGGHVQPADAGMAIDAATSGPIEEGSVGGGTGMNCYAFKGGSGTASRTIAHGGERYTVGVFIQANFGSRRELRLAGMPLGRDSCAPNPMEGTDWLVQDGRPHRAPGGAGSAIIVIATDAPLLPGQCAALARRAPLGLARTGTAGSHFSGDIALAFSTANPGSLTSSIPAHRATRDDYESLAFIPWGYIDPFYTAVVEAVEEAVANALVVNQDMTGRDGHFSPALPHEEIVAALGRRAG